MNPDLVQYVVFAPTAALSRSRWDYYQMIDGTIQRTISGPTFGESAPMDLNASEAFPDAYSWARCLHGGKRQFQDCPEANEIYSTLCNVVMYLERGENSGARVCLDGIIKDSQEWLRRLHPEPETPTL
jgi:hypothetical protein